MTSHSHWCVLHNNVKNRKGGKFHASDTYKAIWTKRLRVCAHRFGEPLTLTTQSHSKSPGWAACVRMLFVSVGGIRQNVKSWMTWHEQWCEINVKWYTFLLTFVLNSIAIFISTSFLLSQRSCGAADWLVWYTQWDANRNGRNVRAITAGALEELYCIWNLYNSAGRSSFTLISKEQRNL